MIYSDVEVICPFFDKGGRGYIQCEGVIENTFNRMLFISLDGHPLDKERDAYSTIFCEQCFEECEVYKMLNRKYEDKK